MTTELQRRCGKCHRCSDYLHGHRVYRYGSLFFCSVDCRSAYQVHQEFRPVCTFCGTYLTPCSVALYCSLICNLDQHKRVVEELKWRRMEARSEP